MDRSFIAGFLVLGFAIFIAGSLTGMLAIAVIAVPLDTTTLGLVFFILGFVTGMTTLALALVIVWFAELRKTTSRKPESHIPRE